MSFSQMFGLPEGVVSVVGSGGKTTLLSTLARELPGGVILCTTTHIFPFPEYPPLDAEDADQVRRALAQRRVVCVGRPGGDGKLTASPLPLSLLEELAPWVLVEADGSRGLPLKAHAPHEPVIPLESRRTLLVAGASGFGEPVVRAVHRPERFCRLTGAELEDPVTPELAARAIAQEGLARQVFLNQVESPLDWTEAEAFARVLTGVGMEVFAGSLRQGVCHRL